ncbi:MAG: acyl-CoA dehydrogenase family protein [Myxococcota bacterium]
MTVEMIQMHGGVRYTWEYDCHLFYRRAKLLSASLGTPRYWKNLLVDRLRALPGPPDQRARANPTSPSQPSKPEPARPAPARRRPGRTERRTGATRGVAEEKRWTSATPEEAAFRAEAVAWLEANAERRQPGDTDNPLNEATTPEMVAEAKAWQKKKADAGWACITWPKEYGGRGATPMQNVIWNEEQAKFRTPRDI